MKLREFINRLEYLSQNGKNDNMTVEVFNPELMGYDYTKYANTMSESITDVSIDRYVTNNDEYEYIRIDF